MEPNIPDAILKKVKRDFEESPDHRIRKLEGDYGNIRLRNTYPNVTVFGVKCELRGYAVPLSDAEGGPLFDEEGRRDFRIISIYFPEDGRPYTMNDFIKLYSDVKD
jgi:hypothetical protein